MTVNPFTRAARQFCRPAEHSWGIHEFQGAGGLRTLRICERCSRTHVVLSPDNTAKTDKLHKADEVEGYRPVRAANTPAA